MGFPKTEQHQNFQTAQTGERCYVKATEKDCCLIMWKMFLFGNTLQCCE